MPSLSQPSGGRRGLGESNPSLFDADQPFAHEGADPAGYGAPSIMSKPPVSPGDDPFADDEPSAYTFATPSSGPYSGRYRRSRWQRIKEDYLTDVDWTFGLNQLLRRKDKFDGIPREVLLNDPEGNKVKGYEKNTVQTGKYGPITFLPKFLFSEFSRSANLFFLFTACIQQVPGVSPTGRYTTIVPLAVVLIASAFKEVKEDLKRHAQDRSLNGSQALVLANGGFEPRPWKRIRVGDIVRLERDGFIPADIVMISSSEPEGLAYIETANLDGETNLKIKQAHPSTATLTNPQAVSLLRGHVLSEAPNSSLYTYDGTFHLSSAQPGAPPTKIPVGPNQIMLRGSQLRNTEWAYGVVVNAGHQTKLMRNATEPPVKRTAVERQVNKQILYLFILLLVMSIVSAIGSCIRNVSMVTVVD